ncbi:hypothetical protein GPECTOR_17g965 [Gonium pectorale]|uniref:Helicase ATP-binding domain-containing protein n=1 Tax=Gonium pectorale TaxID=33097 RepID=A0A150GKF3_GONPE|nr:hypothetical protein GPECTOR_17g965 [Gonium pectorale]|eukprot:KXZ50326.1 hypothetical protein GPECTOR_17g965 [Gonium pectorale]
MSRTGTGSQTPLLMPLSPHPTTATPPRAPLPPLRDYQQTLLRAACKEDIIVYLETGMGKTRIAVELIARALPSLRRDSRIAVFLAPSVPLVRQQAEVLAAVPDTKSPGTGPQPAQTAQPQPHGGGSGKAAGSANAAAAPSPAAAPESHLPEAADAEAADAEVEEAAEREAEAEAEAEGTEGAEGAEGGDRGGEAEAARGAGAGAGAGAQADTASPAAPWRPLLRVKWLGGTCSHEAWGPGHWAGLLRRCDVLVCTPAVLLGALVRAMIKVSSIGLLVVDEAHHCREQHPYAVLMREFVYRHKGQGQGQGPAAGPAAAGAEADPGAAASARAAGPQAHQLLGGGSDGEQHDAATAAREAGSGTGTDGVDGAAAAVGSGAGASAGGGGAALGRPRLLGLTASPLEANRLQEAMCGSRIVAPLHQESLRGQPSRPKAQIKWVGPGSALPPPPPGVLAAQPPAAGGRPGPDPATAGAGAASSLTAASPVATPGHELPSGAASPSASACAPTAASSSTFAPSACPTSASALSSNLRWLLSVLGLAERVVAARDRLQRLAHLGELDWEQLGLGDEGAALPLLMSASSLRDEFDASLKDIRQLKSQVAAVEAVLHDLGPWPALALAAADLFASREAPAGAAARGGGVAGGRGGVREALAAQGPEDLSRMLEPTDLGPAPCHKDGRELISGLSALAAALQAVPLPPALEPGLTLGDRVAALVLSLVMEGFMALLPPPGPQGTPPLYQPPPSQPAELAAPGAAVAQPAESGTGAAPPEPPAVLAPPEAGGAGEGADEGGGEGRGGGAGGEAAAIAAGFGVALLVQGGVRPCGRGLLTPWALRLLDSVPTAELQQQVLGFAPPTEPAATEAEPGTGAEVPGPPAAEGGLPAAAASAAAAASCAPHLPSTSPPPPSAGCRYPVPLVSHRVAWLLRHLHARALGAAERGRRNGDGEAEDGGGRGGSGAGPSGCPHWSAIVFCERKVGRAGRGYG